MAETKTISTTNLLMDLENPRLAEGQHSQRDAIHAMLKVGGLKTLNLAEDIVANGLNPADRLIVVPSTNEAKRFTVLEGNRRLTALRILNEPTLVDGALDTKETKRLAGLSKQYALKPIKEIDCIVFDSREGAALWIERRHTGQQGGAGIVPWGNLEQERFDARRSGKSSPALQVLDYVIKSGRLSDDVTQKLTSFNMTNLKRLIADKEVRSRLGINVNKGKVTTHFADKDVLPGLTRIVYDVATGLKVVDIYEAQNRKVYLNRFKADELPSPARASNSSRSLLDDDDESPADSKSNTSTTAQRSLRTGKPRSSITPTSCRLNITNARIKNIFHELQTLKVDQLPNAASVLYRVFVELTVDHYVEGHKLLTGKDYDSATLAKKLSTVANDIESRGLMTKKELQPVRQASNDKHLLASSVMTLHAFVHNRHLAPLAGDLRTSWDNLQPFIEKVWPV